MFRMKYFILFYLALLPVALAGLLGAPETTNVDESVLKAANFALDQINQKSENENLKRSLIKITSVTKQLVSGYNYVIHFDAKVGDAIEKCEVKVYIQEWTNTKELTKDKCVPHQLLGGQKPETLDNDVEKALLFAVDSYNGKINSAFRVAPEKVANIRKKETPEGIDYTFTARLVDTSCMNNDKNRDKDLMDCPPREDALRTLCKYHVTLQPQRTPEYEVTDNCRPESYKVEQEDTPASTSPEHPDINEVLKPMLGAAMAGDAKATVGDLPAGLQELMKNKLEQYFDSHQDGLSAILHPADMLGGLTNEKPAQGKDDQSNEISPLLSRVKKELKHGYDLDPLYQSLGKSVLEAFKHGSEVQHFHRGGDNDRDGAQFHYQFKEFQRTYGKFYDTVDEEKKRFEVFCQNMKYARKLNQTEQGTAVYGATKFADLTYDEFRNLYLSKTNWNDIENVAAKEMGPAMGQAKIPEGEFPTSYDWRDHGAVTPVKNQGQCGSCWAFSTTGNIEGQWQIRHKKLVSLSEQELVDCDKVDQGCDGGLPSNAYMAIMKLGGLETESDYKYRAEDEKCRFNKSEAVVDIDGMVNITSNEDGMAAWLAENGPISIGINAMAMQFYFGGISHPWEIFCNPKSLDHGVLIVGYGVKGSTPYWIVKNSWGEDWGEKGYYYVYRGGGVCGLNTMCTSSVVN